MKICPWCQGEGWYWATDIEDGGVREPCDNCEAFNANKQPARHTPTATTDQQ